VEIVPTIPVPVKDTVTIVDLGNKTCIPCKMMALILVELKAEKKKQNQNKPRHVWQGLLFDI